MAGAELAAWCPSHRALGAAELPDHRLAFLRRSIRWQAGAADIVRAPGESVWGVLWELPFGPGDLDAKEAAGDAYRRRPVEVLVDGSPLVAMAYEVIEKEPREVPPRRDYLDLMIAGAREHGLPESWVHRIQSWYYTF
jgi:gamma-glutamylcyclotransferase